jgi:hypothetical protein
MQAFFYAKENQKRTKKNQKEPGKHKNVPGFYYATKIATVSIGPLPMLPAQVSEQQLFPLSRLQSPHVWQKPWRLVHPGL